MMFPCWPGTVPNCHMMSMIAESSRFYQHPGPRTGRKGRTSISSSSRKTTQSRCPRYSSCSDAHSFLPTSNWPRYVRYLLRLRDLFSLCLFIWSFRLLVAWCLYAGLALLVVVQFFPPFLRPVHFFCQFYRLFVCAFYFYVVSFSLCICIHLLIC